MVTNDAFRQAFGLDKQPAEWKRSGKVLSASGGGYMVDFGSGGVRCEAWCSAKAGDVVMVEGRNGRALAVAVRGGSGSGDSSIVAGKGLTKTGNRLDADVDAADLAAVGAKADEALAEMDGMQEIPASWVEAL